MRTIATYFGIVLIAWMLTPLCPPTDWPGLGLDGRAYGCQQTCDQVTAYHDAISESDGYGNTYRYAKLIWENARATLATARTDWVNHVNEECDNDPACDGNGPADGCEQGSSSWVALLDAQGARDIAYLDMEDSWDDWKDAAGICGVIRLVMLSHCQSHGHAACEREEETPTR